MKKFEYLIIKAEEGQGISKILSEMGEMGWEGWFCDPAAMLIYFKREKVSALKLC